MQYGQAAVLQVMYCTGQVVATVEAVFAVSKVDDDKVFFGFFFFFFFSFPKKVPPTLPPPPR